MEYYGLTAGEIAHAVRNGDKKAIDITETFLARIGSVDGKVRATLTITEEKARETAASVDEKVASGIDPGKLAGVPVVVKDNISTAGIATTAGSRILEPYVPLYDASVVERLKAAGAIVVAKANLDEFAMGSSNEHSGYFPVRNPHDLARVPGGSSGGSAAAVAAGMAPLSLGSDTGGSVRQPAAFCGVTGLKPTYGRVPRYGLIAFASSFDQIGPIARTAEDVALFLEVIAGGDERDFTSLPGEVPEYTASIADDIKGLRIGVPREYVAEGIDKGILDAFNSALEALAELGAEIVEVSLPHYEYGVAAYYIVANAEASSNLARYEGVQYGHRACEYTDLEEMFVRTRDAGFGDEVKRRIMLGTYVLSAGYYDAYYLRGLKARRAIAGDFGKAFEQVDIIASPTMPMTAFKLGEKLDDPLQMYLCDVLTVGVNLAGLPAISVPCGFVDGLPAGMQFIAPALREDVILRAAHNYQKITDYHTVEPAGV